jgi:hypothetical protein
MEAVDHRPGAARQPRQQGVGGDLDFMDAVPAGGLLAVLDGARDLRGDVLQQRAAREDRQGLGAPADAQHRHVHPRRQAQRHLVEAVAQGRDRAERRQRRLAEEVRRHVRPAGDQQALHAPQ